MKNYHPKSGKKQLPPKQSFDQFDGNISLEELAKLSLEPKENSVSSFASKKAPQSTKETARKSIQKPIEDDISLHLFQGSTPIPDGVYQPNQQSSPQKTILPKSSSQLSKNNTSIQNTVSSLPKTDNAVVMRLDDFLQEEQENKTKISEQNAIIAKLHQDILTIQKKHTQELAIVYESMNSSIDEKNQTIAQLQIQVDRMHESLADMQTQLRLMGEQKQQLAKEVERANQVSENVGYTANFEVGGSIAAMLQRKGLLSLEEKQQFFVQLIEHPVLFGALQHMTHGSTELVSMLHKNTWLVGEHIYAHHHISGVCISVSKEKCEISRGVDIMWYAREITTEILLRGWRQLLILGVPLALRNTLYSWLASSSLEVQIDEWQTHVDAQCVLQARDVDVVLVHNLDNICVPEHTSIPVYRYSDADIGGTLERFYKQIREE